MKDLVREYVAEGLRLKAALNLIGMSNSTYYYKRKPGSPGRKPSTHTMQLTTAGVIKVLNEVVLHQIRRTLGLPFVDYGYKKMTYSLQNEGYHINKKKVYRLMKEEGLLHKLHKGAKGRLYVKYRAPRPTRPLEVLEMDIKYVYVHGRQMNAYILTIIDTFTRKILGWKVGFSMRQDEVMELWQEVITAHLQPADLLSKNLTVTVRSDNGSQFLADRVKTFFLENQVVREFTHPYTPQENGHIESFHAILAKALAGHTFQNLAQVQVLLEEFYYFYNYERVHSAVCNLSPVQFEWALEQDFILIDESRWKVRTSLKIKRQELFKELAIGQWSPKGVCAV